MTAQKNLYRICVIGNGYVGLTTGAVLADWGHAVTCIDTDGERAETIKAGRLPFYEPDLAELLRKNVEEGRLVATTDFDVAVPDAEIVFITVGTPSDETGDVDVGYVEAAAASVGRYLQGYTVVVVKSTVPVGTTERVHQILLSEVRRRHGGSHAASKGADSPDSDRCMPVVDTVCNPEFLRQGRAVKDFTTPDRIVIGSQSDRATQYLRNLYQNMSAPIITTHPRSAELIKYAANAFLATKISIINEVANLCERFGADVRDVAKGMGMDRRIVPLFLEAGVGFGGSCFPKDLKGIVSMGVKSGYKPKVFAAALEVNDSQQRLMVEKLKSEIGGLEGRRIAVLGLSFKPHTDDIREAPSIGIVKQLLEEGAVPVAFDPKAMANFRRLYPQLEYTESPYSALRGADAAIVVTEWDEFRALDLERAKALMRTPCIIDGRNVFDGSQVRALGFRYQGVGQPR